MDLDDLRLAPRPHTAELLRWAEEQGLAPAPEAAVTAVLTLLELGDAQLHDGFPELTSPLLQELLYERLHLYVQPVPEQPPHAYGDAVRLLIDHQRAAKRLNAKRQQRLHEEAEWQGELLAGLLRQPHLLTWPRLYTLLLRGAASTPPTRRRSGPGWRVSGRWPSPSGSPPSPHSRSWSSPRARRAGPRACCCRSGWPPTGRGCWWRTA